MGISADYLIVVQIIFQFLIVFFLWLLQRFVLLANSARTLHWRAAERAQSSARASTNLVGWSIWNSGTTRNKIIINQHCLVFLVLRTCLMLIDQNQICWRISTRIWFEWTASKIRTYVMKHSCRHFPIRKDICSFNRAAIIPIWILNLTFLVQLM